MINVASITFMVGIKESGGVRLLGSSFLLPKAGCFITCRHVVGNNSQNLVLIPPKIANDYQDTTDEKCSIINVELDDVNTQNDLAILKCSHANVSPIQIASLDDVNVGEELELWGYPHCVNDPQMHVCTLQRTHLGAKIFKSSNGLKYKYGVLNIQTRPGQSGSMVYSRRMDSVVGILVGGYAIQCGISLGGINPYELNQTSFCLSAEYIQEIL